MKTSMLIKVLKTILRKRELKEYKGKHNENEDHLKEEKIKDGGTNQVYSQGSVDYCTRLNQ